MLLNRANLLLNRAYLLFNKAYLLLNQAYLLLNRAYSLPCSTISVVEKCQRRKGLVSSKYPTARENTETGKIVGWMLNRFTPVVRFQLLKNVNVEKVL